MNSFSSLAARGCLGLALALLVATGAWASSLEVKRFRLAKRGEEQALVTIREQGTIRVKAQVRSPIATAPLSLVLQGPDGIQVERNGPAPLRLLYELREPERFGTWRATVRNIGNMALVTGKLEVGFTPGTAPDAKPGQGEKIAAPDGGQASSTQGSTESPQADRAQGKVTYPEDLKRLRAVCRGKNEGVFVRLDLENETGTYFMNYNPVFALEPSYQSEHVIELRGSGENPLYLDTQRKVLYFQSGERGTFCKVRIYYGES